MKNVTFNLGALVFSKWPLKNDSLVKMEGGKNDDPILMTIIPTIRKRLSTGAKIVYAETDVKLFVTELTSYNVWKAYFNSGKITKYACV